MVPLISVIIATYNRKKMLERCLDSLVDNQSGFHDFEVIVVDDGSNDGTHAYLGKKAQEWPALRAYRQTNKGPASARNLGAHHAHGNILAFTDDDCISTPGWLVAVTHAMADSGNVAVSGPVHSESLYRKARGPFDHVIDQRSPPAYLSCNLAVRKDVFQKLGGFDERFPLAAHEDVDLCLRMLDLGRIDFCYEMIVNHPPRPRKWSREVLQVWKYGRNFVKSERLLYDKNPNKYAHIRFRTTAFQTLLHLSMKFTLLYARCPLRMALRHPIQYLRLVSVSGLRHVSLACWFGANLWSFARRNTHERIHHVS